MSGATLGTLVLRDGTDATGDVYVQKKGTANDMTTLSFAKGLYFPNGVFYDHDTNTTFTVIEYEIEQ